MKTLLLSFCLMATAGAASAQFAYSLTVLKQPYQPLASSINLNDTTRWDDDFYQVPLGFQLNFGGKTTSSVQFESGVGFSSSNTGIVNAFMVTDLDLQDRGNAGDTVTRSPLSYAISGTAGSRVATVQVANAGIYDEWDTDTTNLDSVNYQACFYEGTNVIEFRFGPSNVNKANYADYYFLTGEPMMGYVKDITLGTSSFDKFYYFTGDYKNPVLDSTVGGGGFGGGGMTEHPTDSTVYRFTPIPMGIKDKSLALSQLNLISNIGAEYLVLQSGYERPLDYKVVSINGAATNTRGTVQKGVNHVNLNQLAQGMYVLYVSGTDGMQAYRIYKQ